MGPGIRSSVSRVARSFLVAALCVSCQMNGKSAPEGSPPEEREPGSFHLPEILATVNGKDISRAAYQRTFQGIMENPNTSVEQKTRNAKRVLAAIIDVELLAQESMKRGILAMTEETEDHRATAIERLVEQEVDSRLQLTEADVELFYKSNPQLFTSLELVRLSRITIKNATDNHGGGTTSKAVWTRTEEIHGRAVSGEDFGKLARMLSEDPKATEGGDLGYYSRGGLSPELEEKVFSLGVGEVSPIIRSGDQLLLFKVTERHPPTLLPFEKAKEMARGCLSTERRQQAVRRLIDKIRQQSSIQVFLDP